MFPGETILTGAPTLGVDTATDGGVWQVMQSAAGWYIGTTQHGCPYSRETGYMSQADAAATLIEWNNSNYVHART